MGIALDGWLIVILDESYYGIGASTQYIGRALGNFLGFILFIQLNSVNFCNDFIYDEPKDYPILEAEDFVHFMAWYCLIIVTCVALFKKEEHIEQSISSVSEGYRLMKGFYKNDNILYIIIVTATWRIGFMVIDAIYTVRLLKDGYPKELLILVVVIVIPISIVVAKILGDYAIDIGELTIFINGQYWKFASTFVHYWTAEVYWKGNIGDSGVTVMLIFNGIINCIGDLSY